MAGDAGRPVAGILALAAVAILIAGAFVGLGVEAWRNPAGALDAFDGYLVRIARFTLWQALLSTVVSIVPAIFVARALSRHPEFPGRAMLLRLFALPLSLPAIVAVLGVLALLGRSGLVAKLSAAVGLEGFPSIYGLGGILIAHAFYNIPLATRLFLQALETTPNDQWRLASQLGMGAGPVFRLIEWPLLRSALPGVAGLVFMLCVTSFTVVLTLGGGPRATTLEVGIYQALRFDFDPARAVALTLVQVALTAIVVFALARLGAAVVDEASLAVSRRCNMTTTMGERAANGAIIALCAVFVGAPIVAIIASGLNADLAGLVMRPGVQRAALTSLVLAITSAFIAVSLTWALVAGRRLLARRRGGGAPGILENFMDSWATFVLVVPPIVIGSGWFMLLRQSTDIFTIAPAMVIAVNAVMAMPFAMRAMRPAFDAAGSRHDRLCSQLGISGWHRFRLIDWPAMRRAALTALVFAMALSFGDLGVIALFGSEAVQTLPYLLLASMGSYRTADAAGLALILGAICLGLTIISDYLGRAEAS